MRTRPGNLAAGPSATRLVLPAIVLLLTVGTTACPERTPGRARDASRSVDPDADELPAPAFDDWYPARVAPPPGTGYPCAVLAEHPLPKDLAGIPGPDRRYVNHVCAQLVAASQANLIFFRDVGAEAVLETYVEATNAALARIAAEPVPEGLEPFHEELIRAIQLQQECLRDFDARLQSGFAEDRPWDEVWKEARLRLDARKQASTELLGSARERLQDRYQHRCPEATWKSIDHHLCALKLF